MAYVHAAQSQQQGHQYPPPPTGQKAEYNGQSYSTYNEGYNGPQYPPAAYDQGHTPQPVSTIPISSLTASHPLSCRYPRTVVMGRRLALPLTETPITCRELVWLNVSYRNSPSACGQHRCISSTSEFTMTSMT